MVARKTKDSSRKTPSESAPRRGGGRPPGLVLSAASRMELRTKLESLLKRRHWSWKNLAEHILLDATTIQKHLGGAKKPNGISVSILMDYAALALLAEDNKGAHDPERQEREVRRWLEIANYDQQNDNLMIASLTERFRRRVVEWDASLARAAGSLDERQMQLCLGSQELMQERFAEFLNKNQRVSTLVAFVWGWRRKTHSTVMNASLKNFIRGLLEKERGHVWAFFATTTDEAEEAKDHLLKWFDDLLPSPNSAIAKRLAVHIGQRKSYQHVGDFWAVLTPFESETERLAFFVSTNLRLFVIAQKDSQFDSNPYAASTHCVELTGESAAGVLDYFGIEHTDQIEDTPWVIRRSEDGKKLLRWEWKEILSSRGSEDTTRSASDDAASTARS